MSAALRQAVDSPRGCSQHVERPRLRSRLGHTVPNPCLAEPLTENALE